MQTLVRILVVSWFLVGTVCAYQRLEVPQPREFSALKARADKGDREAMFALFRIYDGNPGSGIVQADGDSESLAFFWLQKAANGGHAEAMFKLAMYWRYSEAPDRKSRYVRWLTKSAEAGLGRAMMTLADEASSSQAVTWYQKAVEVGQPDAFARLAEAYLIGRDVPYDPQKAIDLFTRGSTLKSEQDPEAGDRYDAAHCMFELGQLYRKGEHVAIDEAAAAKWFLRASEADYFMISPYANVLLAELLIRGGGVPRDLSKARDLLGSVKEWSEKKEAAIAALTAAESEEALRQSLKRERSESAGTTASVRDKRDPAVPSASGLGDRVGAGNGAGGGIGVGVGDRLLVPPRELAGMEPVDVYFMMDERVAPPATPDSPIDHRKSIPGTIYFSSMRMWLIADEAEFTEAQRIRTVRAGRPYSIRLRGSDVTGGRIMLGWVAWVCVSDWWPSGYGYPNEGVGYCYGAATLDEALTRAYRTAIRALRENYSGPVRCIQVNAGVSAKPKRDLYQQNKTFSDICELTYSFVLETPSTEKEAREFGFAMMPPENPDEFPQFARVTMRTRRYPQVIIRPGFARDYPRSYGSYGLANAPVPINPRLRSTKDEIVAAGFPDYFFKEAYFSDEPPAFTVLPFGK
jgi:TPR repeat protein